MESTLLIPIAVAEPVVADWRLKFDPSAAAGVPAHVTLLYPFKPADSIDQSSIEELAAFFATWSSFEGEFLRTGRFGSEVLYLEPEPVNIYRAMTTSLVDKYPEFPLYGGEYDEVTPHLTVAHASHGGDLDAIELEVVKGLPITTKVSEALLMEQGADGRWRTRTSFPLRGTSA